MYLGIDIGTSELKAVVIDDSGQIIADSHVALTVQRPHLYWSEQSPELWWTATHEVIGALRQKMADKWGSIRAIGLSGQMHGAVLLGKKHQVLRPCILWNDTRSAEECRELTEAHPEFHTISGNLVMPGFTAPKLVWVAKHEPEIFKQIAQVLLPKDYLRWMLTGEFVSDVSDSAGTLWLDVERRDWSEKLLSACGLRREQMPRLVEGSEASGVLKPELAHAWGLNSQVVVAGGGGDNAASAVGVGAVNPGDAFISLGTSGVLFVVNEKFRPNALAGVHAFCHALPGRWHQMSVMLSAASCLRWLCQTLSVTEPQLLAEVDKMSEAEQRRAPIFLPYLSGERTPHNDPLAFGSFYGLRNETHRAALGYAVLEGVAFGLADGLEVLQDSGSVVNECSLTGGGARSHFWGQLIADTLNIPIVTHPASSSGALGAARLGWLSVGGDEQQICQKPIVEHRFTPDKQKHLELKKRQGLFRLLYQQQKEARELLVLE